jgi:hypothetical protein
MIAPLHKHLPPRPLKRAVGPPLLNYYYIILYVCSYMYVYVQQVYRCI